ncbi:hypothetical protein CEY12_02595 [Chryseobacterium sp. T16E-39]|uniref:hypothetical protein n=1 Tax=Chryseobacterium sp. T16E-39 TaxID=2015076 RepID=UPI000B5B3EBA|nr:hypothetical protein [Chryseobacterium sp. T16E-39]ASK32655.1 hypothetical protein CEY12_02595 [Chryseobacterium sp. T16E-39]
MKKGFGIFWMLYMLFFAIPFPMILYYNIKSDGPANLNLINPWLALGVLALSVVLWIITLVGYFRKWVLSNFTAKKNIEYLNKNGIHRKAEIKEAVKVSKDGSKYDSYELKLLFKNLVDTEILQKAFVNDSKPQQRRFESGKKIDILIDKEVKRIPYFIFAGTEATINVPVIFLICLGWLTLVVLVSGYYMYSYLTENMGMGWRFIAFWHPLVLCPAILLLYRVGLSFIFKLAGGGKKGEAELIKFKGIKTTANLLSVNQTGTYINEQPMVLFKIEYVDYQNRTRRSELKKIVNLLELDVVRQPTIDIFYLKENPDRIAFASDLNEIS